MRILLLFCGILLATFCVAATPTLERAAKDLHDGRFARAESELATIIKGNPENLDAALYLNLKAKLGLKRADEVVREADEFLDRFPNSPYAPYARFAKAEGEYLLRDVQASSDDLRWAMAGADDPRLYSRARIALAAVDGNVSAVQENAAVEAGKAGGSPPASARIVLLIAFAWADDPASEDIQKSFTWAFRHADSTLSIEVVKTASPYETATACDTLMARDGLRLLVFAGDEGAAAAVALKSSQYRVPVLKLTSDPRSYSALSNYVFEFLPSGESQARALGEFAAKELKLAGDLVLTSADAKGRALADGFRVGTEKSGIAIEAERTYAPDAQSIRADIGDALSSEKRSKHGAASVTKSLTPTEQAEAFGDSARGEVLFSGVTQDSANIDTAKIGEGLFFTLSPDKIASYCNQLRQLPARTTLLGNSSWIDEETLAQQSKVTDGMYIVTPLLPEVSDTIAVISAYKQFTGAGINEWVTLGIDAGSFVGKILATQPKGRTEVMKAITSAPRSEETAVVVDFRGTHENRSARILQYLKSDLKVIK